MGYSKGVITELAVQWRKSLGETIPRCSHHEAFNLFPCLIDFLGSRFPVERDGADIALAERRLGFTLPDDYVEFLGLFEEIPAPAIVPAGNRFLFVHELREYPEIYPDAYAIWKTYSGSRVFDQIGIYGDAQLPESFSMDHLESCVAISTNNGSGVYLINPLVRKDGGMETWVLDFHFPGALRFPSFVEFIEHEFRRSIDEIASSLSWI